MLEVLEVRLEKPVEVAWDNGPPMPVITLRRPEFVRYNPATRMLHIDTGRGAIQVPLEGGVVRMALGGAASVTPGLPTTSKASASPPLPPERSEASVATTPTPAKGPALNALKEKAKSDKW